MSTDALTLVVVSALAVAAFATTLAAARSRIASRTIPGTVTAILTALVALGTLAFVVLVAARMNQGTNYFVSVMQSVMGRDMGTLASIAFGVLLGSPWIHALFRSRRAERRRGLGAVIADVVPDVLSVVALVGLLGVFIVLVARAEYDNPKFASFLWKDAITQHGFDVRKIADIGPAEAHPISLAVDGDENVYVSYHTYFIGKEHGGVHRFEPNEDLTEYKGTTVIDSPLLARPFGLAVRDGDLYVSRSGRLGFARDGELSHEPAGAVTRIRDLDGDGLFEYMDDILVGLPGARGPDTQHQNQGILFLPDGRLLVTNGVPSDHAPATHPWEGVILELSADFQEVRVFAEGLRNPFGLTVTADGNIIATDNDSSSLSGDELNAIVRGGHYGHPYDHDPKLDAEGFIKPIFRAPVVGNFVGVTQVPPDHPSEALRGCLLIADHVTDAVWRVKINETSEGVEVVEAQPFFDVPAPLNVVVGPSGTIYVLSYGIYSTSGLYSITAK